MRFFFWPGGRANSAFAKRSGLLENYFFKAMIATLYSA